mgnify:CR=1 FL=1
MQENKGQEASSFIESGRMPHAPPFNVESARIQDPFSKHSGNIKTKNNNDSGSSHTYDDIKLPSAPILRPNNEEFADPMSYIYNETRKYQNHGIVKIIPPKGWKCPFSLNTDVSIIFV